MKNIKIFALLLALVLCFSLLAACGGTAEKTETETETETTTETATTETATTETLELKYADFQPDGIPTTDYFEEACDAIYERTEGRVKITCYFSGTLLTFPEIATGVSEGTADFAYYMTGTAGGMFPLGEFANLPLLPCENTEQAYAVYTKIYEEFSALDEEAAQYNIVPVSLNVFTPFQLHMVTDEVITEPSQLNGKSIIADGRIAVGTAAIGNVDAMTLSSDQFYSTLQKGVADGQITHNCLLTDFALQELTKTHTYIKDRGFALPTCQILANGDSWNKISEGDQEIIIEEFANYQKKLRERDAAQLVEIDEALIEAGQTITYLNDEQIALWEEQFAQPAIQAWIEECEANGQPAQEIYDRICELCEEGYGK